MHSSVFVLSLSLALAGVHSSPVPSVSSEVDSPRAVRALPSGDLYPPQPPGAGPGKRGLIYNSDTKVEWSEFYVGSPYVTYGSNGDFVRGDQIDAHFSYVPTLVVDSNLLNSEWNELVPILIEGGTKAIFASDEPDNPAGANLSPAQCVTVYRNFMQPYYGTVQLGTPAVTNGGGQAGLTYLDNFATICTGCAFNFVNVHFFVDRSDMAVAQYVQALKDYVNIYVPAVQAKHDQLNGLPIAIGKFWLIGASESEAGDLMNELLPWLDSKSNILFYQGAGGLSEHQFVNGAGTGYTPAGVAYQKAAP